MSFPTLDGLMDFSLTHDEAASTAPAEQREMFAPAGALDAELDAMERELADVEVALVRLDAGSYWTCEVSGAPLPDHLLAEHPAARRITQH
jgi:RNA polymerase-binding transcription factor DksA